jgi:hypothetical protein
MKSLRFMPSVVLMSISTLALAQSDAQKSFDKLKTLAISWEGHVTTVPLETDIVGKLMRVSLRVTSTGNAVIHEMTGAVAGSTEYGHMDHAVFTVIDANHHTEDWTYMMPGDKPVHAHTDLQRTK